MFANIKVARGEGVTKSFQFSERKNQKMKTFLLLAQGLTNIKQLHLKTPSVICYPVYIKRMTTNNNKDVKVSLDCPLS